MLAGCFSPHYPVGVPCGPGDRCPGHQICDLARGVCVAELPVRDAATDGSQNDGALDAAADAAGPCPSTYTTSSGSGSSHRYRAVTNATLWPTARAACASDGAYLAIPDDATEATFLTGLAPYTWTAITDRAVEGTFVTLFGTTPPYLAWAPGEPNNATVSDPEGQDCAVIYPDGTFDDDFCDQVPHYYVCECDQ